MNDDAWIKRLREQLPGWVIFRSGGSLVGVKWHAAPAPSGTPGHEGFQLPNRVSASTPAELRALARERYGWDDTCESCGVLARECGHRQPECEKTAPR